MPGTSPLSIAVTDSGVLIEAGTSSEWIQPWPTPASQPTTSSESTLTTATCTSRRTRSGSVAVAESESRATPMQAMPPGILTEAARPPMTAPAAQP